MGFRSAGTALVQVTNQLQVVTADGRFSVFSLTDLSAAPGPLSLLTRDLLTPDTTPFCFFSFYLKPLHIHLLC